ncbi:MAG TPA: DUF547 domain-containing protein [Thermoanaerobaculia bacterium]|nr:DUF547 domain-containing protein [Thermoanaerobaculia bacterium]
MRCVFLLLIALVVATPASAADPDYRLWQGLLAKHYDPAKGMNYKGLKADKASLDRLRQQMAAVDVAPLSRPEQLAYWINLYNISTANMVVESYPVDSIRDISTDPVVRLNVFKKPHVKVKGGTMSLNDVENEKIRAGFKDPRIHFAINCAAESCPPIRPEPYVGARIDQQLDDQARKFLNGPMGVRLEQDGSDLVLHATKIMDWFKDDFEQWGGGSVAFLKKHLSSDKVKRIEAAGKNVELEFVDYSWKLNDTSR